MKNIFKSYGFNLVVILPISFMILLLLGCKKEDNIDDPIDPPFMRLVESSIKSEIMVHTIKYSVLLPVDYKTSGISYPVVYLLHGYGDNYTAWSRSGNIQHHSDNMGAEIGPMIFVMPDGYNSYFLNNFSGSYLYMDMFVKELVPEIDKLYRTKKEASQRAVMGYSMGGYGALALPAKNPDVFSISVPLSMSFRTDEQYLEEPQGVFNSQWASIFGGNGISGPSRLTPYFKQYSPFYFFEQNELSEFSSLKLFFVCGDDEATLSVTNGALHNLLRTKNFAHEYRMGNGGHDFSYWYKVIPEALRFINKGFQGESYPSEMTPVDIGPSIANGQYIQENVGVTNTMIGVFRPTNYASSTTNYPAIFYLNDSEGADRIPNAIKVMSFLNNSMQSGKIPHSVIVEIPCANGNVSEAEMNSIIAHTESNHRIVATKESRILLGNSKGGENAWLLMPEIKNEIKNCFIFDALLPDIATAETGIYYYIDATHKTVSFKGNYSLYVDLKSRGLAHEYRIRQGSVSFQSFINGIDGSGFYLNKQLKNL